MVVVFNHCFFLVDVVIEDTPLLSAVVTFDVLPTPVRDLIENNALVVVDIGALVCSAEEHAVLATSVDWLAIEVVPATANQAVELVLVSRAGDAELPGAFGFSALIGRRSLGLCLSHLELLG